MEVQKLKGQNLEVQELKLQGWGLEGVLGGYLGALGGWRRLG